MKYKCPVHREIDVSETTEMREKRYCRLCMYDFLSKNVSQVELVKDKPKGHKGPTNMGPVMCKCIDSEPISTTSEYCKKCNKKFM